MKTAGPQLWRPPDVGRPPLDPDLWNALVSHLGAALPIGPKTTCRFDAGHRPQPAVAAATLRLASGQSLVVVPVEFPFAAAHGAELSVADLPVLPPPLRDALTEGIVSLATAALPFAGAPETAALGLLSDLDPGDAWPWFRATLVGLAVGPVILDVAASPANIASIFGGAPMRSVRPGLAARLDGLVVSTLGRMRASLAELVGWREGTVVVLDGAAASRPLRLRAKGTLFTFDRRGDSWHCTAAEAERREDRVGMAQDVSAPRGDGAALDLSGLEVDVDFDLGRASVSLAEIEGWQPGSLVVLPEALSAGAVTVTLRVNGRAVGAGDLVQIDGRLAVRLSSIAP